MDPRHQSALRLIISTPPRTDPVHQHLKGHAHESHWCASWRSSPAELIVRLVSPHNLANHWLPHHHGGIEAGQLRYLINNATQVVPYAFENTGGGIDGAQTAAEAGAASSSRQQQQDIDIVKSAADETSRRQDEEDDTILFRCARFEGLHVLQNTTSATSSGQKHLRARTMDKVSLLNFSNDCAEIDTV